MRTIHENRKTAGVAVVVLAAMAIVALVSPASASSGKPPDDCLLPAQELIAVISPEMQAWIDARKRHRLSHAQVQMARELGMNPKKLGKLDNHDQEPWKAPLPIFIEELYEKRFGRSRPETVRSIEELARERARKKETRREAKEARRAALAGTAKAGSDLQS